MRRNQPDKAQQPRLADRRTHHEGSHHHQHQGDRPNIHPHAGSHFLPQEKQVHGASHEKEQEEAGCEAGREDQSLGSVGEGEVSHEPEKDIVQACVLGKGEQKHDERRAEGVDHDSGQDQGILFEGEPHRGDDEHQEEGGHAAGKGQQGHSGKPRQVEQNPDDGADRRTPGNAQDIRFRQRIAQQRLKDEPPQRQGCPGQGREQDPRQANPPDDVGQGLIGTGRAGQQCENFPQVLPRGTDGKPQPHAEPQEDSQHRRNGQDASRN